MSKCNNVSYIMYDFSMRVSDGCLACLLYSDRYFSNSPEHRISYVENRV